MPRAGRAGNIERMSMMPPMYVCEICGHGLRPDDLGVCKKVTGWVENKKTGTGSTVIRKYEHGVFAHKVCLETKQADANQMELF